ncbi:MAG TPA: GDSL-type esterase/lipase family protein [Polyangiaceae bacterium]|nr:GDSL-type esterase/lipase family protein [Polyangiaceae bacterium]HNZ22744.1 GDSL-type esterase/lipase family protein [Polyangiaceae bacterium]HOE47642.1 GDSL-type esterase/lipase family protein [Polyangiaceae bacterium]HOH01157.1 GDSL-type esterase/lipase family protein [Polyangiaceae bacterium]HOR34949.1 GDSL-type esterase/lipase family protein [Polyangiaceae bacterium]
MPNEAKTPAESRSSPESPSGRNALIRVFWAGLGLFGAIAVPYLIPTLYFLRPWVPGGEYVPFWNIVGRELLGEGKILQAEQEAMAAARLEVLTPALPVVHTEPTEPAAERFPPYADNLRIEKPAFGIEPPEALDHFYEKLALADLGIPKAIARAGHWGDSVLAIDGITSGIRRRLQTRFGDAGHGFHLMDRYDPGYRQRGIEYLRAGGWYSCFIVQQCSKNEPFYGYGGLIARSGGGGMSTWRTPKEGFGSEVSFFELWFGRQTKGGKVEIVVDKDPPIIVDTRGKDREDGWYAVTVPRGGHRFRVRAAGGGDVRLYGVVLENDGPGVVWDGMVMIAGSTRQMRTQDATHISHQVRHRNLDLIVFLFGGNDMKRNHLDLKESMEPYYEEYGEAIRKYRAGKPTMSCLVLSMTDRGERTVQGTVVSRKFAKQLSKAQREVAKRNGCGYFDTYEATGGDGSIAKWYRANPPLISPDLGHPSAAGHEYIASLVANAILHGYQQYRDRMAGSPLPTLEASDDPKKEAKDPLSGP